MATPATETRLATTNQDRLKSIMRSDETIGRFAELMNKREAMAYISGVLLEVANTAALQDCTPQSIIVAAMKAATLGLSCSRETGQAYLVPFKDHGTPKATLVIGYRGIEQLALRTGKYRYINVARVFEGQTVEEDQLSGKIAIKGFRKTADAKVIGYCLYFELLSGYSKALYMTVEELWKHAERYSKTFKSDSSLWKTETDKMMMKTVLRLGLSKYGYLNPFDRATLEAIDEAEPTEDPNQIDSTFTVAEPAESSAEEEARIQAELGFETTPTLDDLKKEKAKLQVKDAEHGLTDQERARLETIEAELKARA